MSGYSQNKCITPGCKNKQVVVNYNYCKSGLPGYRKWCSQCHNKRTAEKRGCKSIAEVVALNAGHDSVLDYLNEKAINEGYSSSADRLNANHPYRKHRKSYCENKDGRLGYKCHCKIRIDAQLQVDHIDGDPSNNDPDNLQTLCSNCHIYKTHDKKDYSTPGRKSLKRQGASARH